MKLIKLSSRNIALFILFFATMITSLWPGNIYILFLFSIATLLLLPFKRWWDGTGIAILFFSIFYCLIQRMNATGEISSGFVFVATLIAPVSFYRFGNWAMDVLNNDRNRMWFVFAFVLCYILPVFLLTIADIQLSGFVNENRTLLGDLSDNNLAATLYGLMSSVGIGFISALFAKRFKMEHKLLFVMIGIISMVTVLHLVNRTY